MYFFPEVEAIHHSMSSYNCCFLACIHISQAAGQVVWYSHLFKNFPVCCDPHSQRLHSTVSETEVDVFLEFFCFFCDPADVGNLTSGSSAFPKSSLYIWNFLVHNCWSLAWSILSITLLACEMSAVVWKCEHSLALSFFVIGLKTELF